MLRKSMLVVLFGLLPGLASAAEQPARDASRGELLYSTQCIACHTTQAHWREKKLATDWAGLQFQVRRWQGASGRGWSKQDISEVSRYLNALYYHYPVPD